MIGSMLALAVLGAIVMTLVRGLQDQGEQVNRAVTTQDVSARLERMTRELRNATAVQIVSPTQIDLHTPLRQGGGTSTPRHVVYTCASQVCRRHHGPVGGSLSGSSETTLTGVLNTDIFTGTPGDDSPSYVTVNLRVASGPSSSAPVEFQDGVSVRKFSP